MKINNTDISTFNADQLKVEIQNAEINNNCTWVEGSLSPIFSENTIGFKTIKLTLLLKGTSRDNILNNISNLYSLLLKPVTLKLDGYTHYYKAILSQDGAETKKTKSKYRYTKELTFLAYEYSDQITKTLTGSDTITLNSNLITPIDKIVILPSSTITQLTIGGLTEDNIIIKNVSDSITFDFTQDIPTCKQGNTNKIADVTLWELPRLKPGNNNITLSTSCTLQLTYNPRFI